MRRHVNMVVVGSTRAWCAMVLSAMMVTSASAQAARAGDARNTEMRGILLGTGYPRPDPERAGPSTAVVVGEKVFVVDSGRGVTARYVGARLLLKNLHAVFLTHLHSDHISGLPDLFNTSWIFGRENALELYGPPGTREMAAALLQFFAVDIPIRRDRTEMNPAAGATINTHILVEGVVYADTDVRVTAFRVDHEPVDHAFGLRFDSRSRSIVVSGDTRPCASLIEHARGADILVQEAYLSEHFAHGKDVEISARLAAYHTTAEEAGRIAEAAQVKTLILTHLIPSHADQELLELAHKHFQGNVIVGADLMEF